MIISNLSFGREKLMVVTSITKGHGKFVAKIFFYDQLNPNDFFILRASSKRKLQI